MSQPDSGQLGRARSVWKFKVPIGNRPSFETVMMPARSEIVHVGNQGDDVYAWAIVDAAETEPEKRRLGAFPTGFHVETQSAAYVGTTELYGGTIVVHVFEDMARTTGERS
jgi:hypothetical protein